VRGGSGATDSPPPRVRAVPSGSLEGGGVHFLLMVLELDGRCEFLFTKGDDLRGAVFNSLGFEGEGG